MEPNTRFQICFIALNVSLLRPFTVLVTFNAGFRGYWSMPRIITDDTRFHYVTTDKELNVKLYSYPNDPRLFVMFDSKGNIAGIRIAVSKINMFSFKNSCMVHVS